MSDVYEVIGHASFLPNIFRASKINMKQWLADYITNSMMQRHSSKANGSSAIQKIPRVLCY
jgi:hypothetical protein